jgi:hypothetical protein
MRDGLEDGYSDARGACVARIGNAQTFLAPAEADERLALYGAAMTAEPFASRFGADRSTVRRSRRDEESGL